MNNFMMKLVFGRYSLFQEGRRFSQRLLGSCHRERIKLPVLNSFTRPKTNYVNSVLKARSFL